jgi:hypothetical protein
LKLYKKEGNILQIISFPTENLEKGDYLFVEDADAGKALIAQVIDVQFAAVPGVLEELLRTLPDGGEPLQGEDIDPMEIAPHITYIQDASLLICKIRATLENEMLSPSSSWLPSRSQSTIKKLSIPMLMKLAKTEEKLPIILGGTKDSTLLTNDGKRNMYYDKIHTLTPSQNFKVALEQLPLNTVMGILVNALHLPGTSSREFRRLWKMLKEQGKLNMQNLGEAIRDLNCNQHVRDALASRFHSFANSGFFTDFVGEATVLDDSIFKSKDNGGAIVINLKTTSNIDRQIVVEYVLGKLVDSLSNWKLKAVFLFAEEAHLYLRETYWDDIVTRMRHYGIFTTFITNQPDTIQETIYRQADNIFLFNFTNEHDLDVVSRAARVDAETVRSIARDLPPHHCLTLGKVVRDFPIVARVRALDIKTLGETRLFFSDRN